LTVFSAGGNKNRAPLEAAPGRLAWRIPRPARPSCEKSHEIARASRRGDWHAKCFASPERSRPGILSAASALLVVFFSFAASTDERWQ